MTIRSSDVTWTEFPFGPPLLEAINVGAIDFGNTGETPPIFAQAAGAPIRYVDWSDFPDAGDLRSGVGLANLRRLTDYWLTRYDW